MFKISRKLIKLLKFLHYILIFRDYMFENQHSAIKYSLVQEKDSLPGLCKVNEGYRKIN